jgi:hypothetical protein
MQNSKKTLKKCGNKNVWQRCVLTGADDKTVYGVYDLIQFSFSFHLSTKEMKIIVKPLTEKEFEVEVNIIL